MAHLNKLLFRKGLSGYGRPVIRPIVSRCTISSVLEKYYKGLKTTSAALI